MVVPINSTYRLGSQILRWGKMIRLIWSHRPCPGVTKPEVLIPAYSRFITSRLESQELSASVGTWRDWFLRSQTRQGQLSEVDPGPILI